MEKSLQSNIWKYYLRQFFAGMFFSVPVIVLFWQENGLSITEIMVLQSIFAIAVVVLEIPTGYFADLYGRKKSLLISGFMILLAITIYSISRNFFHFMVGEILFAIGISFASGASSALIFDTLVHLKEEKNYKKVWGNALFVSAVAVGFSGIIGGFISSISLRYAVYASIPFFAVVIPITLWMKEPPREKTIFKKGYGKEVLLNIKETFLKNRKLMWLILYSGVVYAFNQAALWLYQPYFKVSGLDVVYFGFVFAGFQIVSALTSKYSYKIEEKLGKNASLISLIFLVSVSYFLMSNFVFLFSFSFAFLQQFVRGFRGVVIGDYINRLTSSKARATILSSETFIGKLIYATIIPVIGWITDTYSLLQAMTVLSITTLTIGLFVILTLKRYNILRKEG